VAKTSKLARPIGLRQIAKLLGHEKPTRADTMRVFRYLQRLERNDGVRILHKSGAGQGTRYFTTIPVLREFVPELFYRREETQEALRESVEDLDEKMTRKIDWLAGKISNKIQALEARLAKLERSGGVNGGSQ